MFGSNSKICDNLEFVFARINFDLAQGMLES